MAHVHEPTTYNDKKVLAETTNFSVHPARIYNANTRKIDAGYAIVRKDDKVRQGETTSYATALQACINCENALTMFEAFTSQEKAHVDTEGLLTSHGPDDTDYIN